MQNKKQRIVFLFTLLLAGVTPLSSFAVNEKNEANHKLTPPLVAHRIFEKAKENNNWKAAFATAKHHQVVFMSVSRETNPKNEIGMETHPFDQIILIAEGNAKADLNGKISDVKSGDMIFIPQGTPHNVINSSPTDALKIISIYSDMDIPANSTYKEKSEEPKD